jgi:hypothetical protein
MLRLDLRMKRRIAFGTVVIIASLAGCAGPGPKLFPTTPAQVDQLPGGGGLHWYDTSRDGRLDYYERLNPRGQVVALGYGAAPGRGAEEEVVLADIPPSQQRDLVLILDSVPASMTLEAWSRGQFRLFPRPTAVIAPYPVMTDPCLVDFFHLVPGVAVESDYFDGERQTDGYKVYLNNGVAIWQEKVDYHLRHIAHGSAYMDELRWFDHELRRVQDGFLGGDEPRFIGYFVGTSALGAVRGREGHEIGISRVNRFCHYMMYRTRGRARITLLSDHGHNLVSSKRIPLSDLLQKAGWNVTNRLRKPRDIVLPEFAMATTSTIYTNSPEPVAQDVVKIEGVELAAYAEPDGSVTILGRDSRARITRSPEGYRYDMLSGDPLGLGPIWNVLEERGKLTASGSVADAILFDATVDHFYPDAVDRLWRAFHEQFQHKPDVLVSIADGYHAGSEFQSRMLKLQAAHGNLRLLSTYGFAATTAGELPRVLRMRELAPALRSLGIDVLN